MRILKIILILKEVIFKKEKPTRIQKNNMMN